MIPAYVTSFVGKMSLFTSPPTSIIASSAITSSSGRSLNRGNTRIGANSKIQSHTFICEYVTIGQRCFIGHGVMFANDLFREGKPNADRASWGRIEIGDDVSIGSGATILAVSICDGVVIGAGSVVTKSITEKGVWAGNPARLLRRL